MGKFRYYCDMRIRAILLSLFSILISGQLLAQSAGSEYLARHGPFLPESDWEEPAPHTPHPSVRYFRHMEQSQALMDSLVQWEERVVLHTDRNLAAPGETVYFKAYLTTGQYRQRLSPSGVLRVELLDGQGQVAVSEVFPIASGMSEGALTIPEKADSDSYTLRAYTRWMQNYGPSRFFQQPITITETKEPPIPSVTSRATPAFYPEGGGLLQGIANKLVVRMDDNSGCITTVSGRITNKKGSLSVPVQQYGPGYGMVLFEPRDAGPYFLELSDGRRFPLPEAEPSGYALQANNLDRNRVRVLVRATPDLEGHSIQLRASIADQTILTRQLEIGNDLRAQVELETPGVPAGTMELQLFDETGDLRASRPLLLDDGRNLKISLEAQESEFQEGKDVVFRLRVTDAEGNPVQTDLSLAVADGSQVLSPECSPAQMGVPVDLAERKQRFFADLQTLTSTRDVQFPEVIRFPIQSGLELMGYAYDLNNKLLRNTDIQVMASGDASLMLREVRTDASGMLKLQDLQLYGETPLVFRTKGEDTRSNLVRVEPVHEELAPSEIIEGTGRARRNREKQVTTTPWTEIDTAGLIRLNQAVVSGKKKESQGSPSLYGITPEATAVQDPERPVQTEVLMSRIPGVYVTGNLNMNYRITLPMRLVATMAPVLWVVDGLVLSDQGIDGHPFSFIPFTEIDRIEMVTGPNAAIFGSRGAGGVFLLYTRSGAGMDYIPRKEASLQFRGFAPEQAFDPAQTSLVRGRRSKGTPKSLYWNPGIQTDANGEAIIRFTSPADYSKVRVTAMGVSPDGASGYYSGSL